MAKCLVLDSMQKKCEASLETICHKKPMLSWVSMWEKEISLIVDLYKMC